jgi:hypothetical protein
MAPTQSLDHLILFLPVNPETNLPNVPNLFSNNFTLTPGGVHADGITSNTLILLADGVYIELISFIDSSKVSSHWWGPDAAYLGWKDWCLTNSKSPEENYEKVKETHAEPIRGGRKRADGVDVAWAVTFPKGGNGGQDARGRIPFFCHDVTPRNVRVPLSSEKTTHPCGALGVQEMTVVIKDQALLDETKRIYASLAGSDGLSSGDEVSFLFARVHELEGLDTGARVVLRLPKDDAERKRVDKIGYWYTDVVICAKAEINEALGARWRLDGDETDMGSIWIEYV